MKKKCNVIIRQESVVSLPVGPNDLIAVQNGHLVSGGVVFGGLSFW